MKKVMILTSDKTGNGHRVTANAIEKKLQEMGYDVKKVQIFKMMGKMGESMENSYIPITTKRPWLWKIAHSFSQGFTNLTHWFIYQNFKKAFLKEVKEYKPDLIISVHCMFTKAVSKLIKKNNLDIPFMVDVVDLVNPPKVWRDKRATTTFVPTERVKQEYIKLGFDENKLVVSGFPVRKDMIIPEKPKQILDKVNILMVNPSINVKKNIKFMKEVAKIKNSTVKIVCGLDTRLFEVLSKVKENDSSLTNVEVLGFVTNMNELLADCHILLTKAGPNMLMEGVISASAVVVTGHIPGQEAKNHEFITKNGCGIQCENPNKIYSAITSIIESGEINEFFKNSLANKQKDGSKIIADYIDNFLTKK